MSWLYTNQWIFTFIIGTCVFTFVYFNFQKIAQFLSKKTQETREYVSQKLDSMFVDIDPKKLNYTLIGMSYGLGLLFFLLFWPNFFVGLLFGTVVTYVGWRAPKLIVDALFEKRNAKFVDQMVDSMTIMSNGIKSGLSVPQSMERVVENMQNPISQEFALVLSQNRLGVSLEESLNALGQRIPKPDVQMFVVAVNILKETGGNMAETFATINETIRERQKVQRKIEALTAQGMMQGIILTLIPFLLLLIFLFIDPSFIKPLFNTTLGVVLLFIMLGLQIIGGLVIRKIVKIEV